MLKTSKIDPHINNNDIKNTCKHNYIDMFKLLYKFQYDNIPRIGNFILNICLEHKHLNIFKFLLKDKTIKI